jgi:hypothetical protein
MFHLVGSYQYSGSAFCLQLKTVCWKTVIVTWYFVIMGDLIAQNRLDVLLTDIFLISDVVSVVFKRQ